MCVCCFLLLLFLVWWWWCFGSILFLIVPFSYLNHREAQHECQAQSKSMPDTVLARSLQAIYDCESASAGFASLVDFTSIVVVLILSWACNSSTMSLRDFLFCFALFYRRFLENKKQKLKINDNTNYLWVEYVYTEKRKGEKQIWKQLLHEATILNEC